MLTTFSKFQNSLVTYRLRGLETTPSPSVDLPPNEPAFLPTAKKSKINFQKYEGKGKVVPVLN
jgi:hypothetical protein